MLKKAFVTNLIDLLLVMIAIYLIYAPKIEVALASHVTNHHNYFVHSVTTKEWVCIDDVASGMTFSDTRDRVKNTLRYHNPSSDWHALAYDSVYLGYRIFFEFENNLRCSQLTPSQLNTMRARAYVRDVTSDVCPPPCVSCSCHYHNSPMSTHNGSTDYGYSIIYFKTSLIDDVGVSYHHTIGHEFGHMLGLQDGEGANCSNNNIMHSALYCSSNTDQEWPTSVDRSSATTIAFSRNVPD